MLSPVMVMGAWMYTAKYQIMDEFLPGLILENSEPCWRESPFREGMFAERNNAD
jgi:hypothetical protein